MAVSRHRPLAVSDLEARPGSPSVVVLPGSTDSQASSRGTFVLANSELQPVDYRRHLYVAL